MAGHFQWMAVVAALGLGCAEPAHEQPGGPTGGPPSDKEAREAAPVNVDATIGQMPGDAKSVDECGRTMALAMRELSDARAMHAQAAATTGDGVNQSMNAVMKQADQIRMRDDIGKMKDLTNRLSAMSACIKKLNSIGTSGEK